MGENTNRRERPASTKNSPPSLRLSDDHLYRVFASTRRRRVLYLLHEATEYTVEELATVLAGWDATETGTASSPDDRRTVLTELLHRDLPTLEGAGLVTHDHDRGVVRIEPLDADVMDLLVRSVAAERPQND